MASDNYEQKRLTLQRVNGIKTGYWSPAKKDELIQRLGEYEDLCMEPKEIRRRLKEKRGKEVKMLDTINLGKKVTEPSG